MATSVNPASAVILGETFEAGISLFSPRRAYGGAFTIDPGQVDSDSEYFPIPYVAKTWDYGEEFAFGLSL